MPTTRQAFLKPRKWSKSSLRGGGRGSRSESLPCWIGHAVNGRTRQTDGDPVRSPFVAPHTLELRLKLSRRRRGLLARL